MSFDLEDTARIFSGIRPGYRLVDYRFAAIPAQSVRVTALFSVARTLPKLEEFTLRSVAAGATTPELLSGVLGLEEPIVIEHGVNPLLRKDCLSEAGGLALTAKGRTAVADAVANATEVREFSLIYDSLLRRTVSTQLFGRLSTFTPRQVREDGHYVVDVLAGRFDPRNVPVEELRSVVDRDQQAADVRGGTDRMTLLGVLDAKAPGRCFLPAVMLTYLASVGTEPPQVAFVVEGQLSEPHERAFAQQGLVEKIQIVIPDVPSDGSPEGGLSLGEVEAIEGQIASTQERLRAEEIDSEPGDSASEAVLAATRERHKAATAAAEAEITELRKMIDLAKTRALPVHEHRAKLREAFESSNSRVMVVAPFLNRTAVNRDFIDWLTACLRRGVQAYIGYGIGASEKEASTPFINASAALTEVARRFPNLHLRYMPAVNVENHSKILICDNRFLVRTSFNWLSFVPAGNREFRDERGTLVQFPPESIEEEWSHWLPRFEAAEPVS